MPENPFDKLKEKLTDLRNRNATKSGNPGAKRVPMPEEEDIYGDQELYEYDPVARETLQERLNPHNLYFPENPNDPAFERLAQKAGEIDPALGVAVMAARQNKIIRGSGILTEQQKRADRANKPREFVRQYLMREGPGGNAVLNKPLIIGSLGALAVAAFVLAGQNTTPTKKAASTVAPQLIQNADGSITSTYPDGSVMVKDTSGTETTTYPDGRKKVKDGKTGVTTTNFPDHRQLVENPDGSSIETLADGSTIHRDSQGNETGNQPPAVAGSDIDTGSLIQVGQQPPLEKTSTQITGADNTTASGTPKKAVSANTPQATSAVTPPDTSTVSSAPPPTQSDTTASGSSQPDEDGNTPPPSSGVTTAPPPETPVVSTTPSGSSGQNNGVVVTSRKNIADNTPPQNTSGQNTAVQPPTSTSGQRHTVTASNGTKPPSSSQPSSQNVSSSKNKTSGVNAQNSSPNSTTPSVVYQIPTNTPSNASPEHQIVYSSTPQAYKEDNSAPMTTTAFIQSQAPQTSTATPLSVVHYKNQPTAEQALTIRYAGSGVATNGTTANNTSTGSGNTSASNASSSAPSTSSGSIYVYKRNAMSNTTENNTNPQNQISNTNSGAVDNNNSASTLMPSSNTTTDSSSTTSPTQNAAGVPNNTSVNNAAVNQNQNTQNSEIPVGPYRVGQYLNARLETGIVLPVGSGADGNYVFARTQDGTLWIGQPVLSNTKRINLTFSQAILKNGQTVKVSAQGYHTDGAQGLKADYHDIAPTLANDLIRSSLVGLHNYVDDVIQATSTTITSSGDTVVSRQTPTILQSVAGSASSVFQLPANQNTFVTVAQLNAGQNFVIVTMPINSNSQNQQ